MIMNQPNYGKISKKIFFTGLAQEPKMANSRKLAKTGIYFLDMTP